MQFLLSCTDILNTSKTLSLKGFLDGEEHCDHSHKNKDKYGDTRTLFSEFNSHSLYLLNLLLIDSEENLCEGILSDYSRVI
jgi:hypothetical protein